NEHAEALLETRISPACFRPSRNDERRGGLGLPGTLPELQGDRLGDERHRWVKEPEGPVEHVREGAHRLDSLRAAQRLFGQLHVDVGELAPDEALQRDKVFAEEIAVDQARSLSDRRVRAREDPARGLALDVGPLIRGVALERIRMLVQLPPHEAADLPELVAEI